ncbi:hypothetical protein LEMLEM_LOCUS18323 [Lemmus lemmus]
MGNPHGKQRQTFSLSAAFTMLMFVGNLPEPGEEAPSFPGVLGYKKAYAYFGVY